jgi:hypothetical protein
VRNVGAGQDLDDRLRWSKNSGASWTPTDEGIEEPADGWAFLTRVMDISPHEHHLNVNE